MAMLSSLSCALIFTFMSCIIAAHAQIYVLNQNSGSVGDYSFAGDPVNSSLITGLQYPTSFALSNDGFFYIADSSGILKYTSSGSLVNANLLSGDSPAVVLALSGPNLYLATHNSVSSTIKQYTTSGALVNGSLAEVPGHVTSLTIDKGLIYAASWDASRVLTYSTDGQLVNDLLISAEYPGGIALDKSGSLFLTSHDFVSEYTTDGDFVRTLVSDNFNSAKGIAIGPNGNLYVANNYGGPGGNTIREFTRAGVPANDPIITGLQNPVDLIVVPEVQPSVFAGILLGLWFFWKRHASARQRSASHLSPTTARRFLRSPF